jgi:UDP-N-acetylmuramate dehydrogenase
VHAEAKPMMLSTPPAILVDQPIKTWFGVGGVARRLAVPRTAAELRELIAAEPNAKILGDGANLLVADGGVQELVISLAGPGNGELAASDLSAAAGAAVGDAVEVDAGAAEHLFRLIRSTTDAALCGLENLAGIPACIGGAAAMNAGGKYGSFGDYVVHVDAVDRRGNAVRLLREACGFGYRTSVFGHGELIVTGVRLRLVKGELAPVKAKLKEVTKYKTSTQPMSASSAGCAFKNPTLKAAIEGIGAAGQRVSAGMLIDRAGCKGMTIGTASVSEQHGNFLTASKGGKADDVLALIRAVRAKVAERFGVTLETEVVIWGAEL